MIRLLAFAFYFLLLLTSPSIGESALADVAAEKRTSSLPGATAYDKSLDAQLAARVQTLSKNYTPRTRHLNADGKAKYTNRLLLETSPYLHQHAHNPVNWYPWGKEAFKAAKELNRPVFLSIGYSTCHWCHVMEEESFEDIEIATFLNKHYIAIKVDREERPDIDSVYMSAVQIMNKGRGGWPMSVWLTAEQKPFFAGTYFPPRSGVRGARVGFLTMLNRLSEAYHSDRSKIQLGSEKITSLLKQSLQAQTQGEQPQAEVLHKAAASYKQSFDSQYGGMRSAPKFPSSFANRFLLRYARRTGDMAVTEMVTKTLREMAKGGMYDQVGGGFHRYSTDAKWLVPHFEKMLYDNALLSITYLEAYQYEQDEEFKILTRDILDYITREMTSADGLFYSATDADSLNDKGEREEGWFFTWTEDELNTVLDKKSYELVRRYYNISAQGNFEGRSIPHRTRTLEVVAKELGHSISEAKTILSTAREKLYQIRSTRPAPLRDEKIISAWNGLMISAFARAAFVLNDKAYQEVASRAAGALLEKMFVKGVLYRTYKEGRARFRGYIDDYAFVIAALLDVYESTADAKWLEQAIALDEIARRDFEDRENGGYFTASEQHETLISKEKPAYDGAEPSGNSVMALNLLRLHKLTTDDKYRTRAEKTFRAFSSVIQRSPLALSEMLLALDFQLDEPKEIVIVYPKNRQNAERLLDELRSTFLPNRVLTVVEIGESLRLQTKLIPVLSGKKLLSGEATAYVCMRGTCKLPTKDPNVFAGQIRETAPYSSMEVGDSR